MKEMDCGDFNSIRVVRGSVAASTHDTRVAVAMRYSHVALVGTNPDATAILL